MSAEIFDGIKRLRRLYMKIRDRPKLPEPYSRRKRRSIERHIEDSQVDMPTTEVKQGPCFPPHPVDNNLANMRGEVWVRLESRDEQFA